MKTAKCNWCGKTVAVSAKGRLMPHVNPGNVKCIGVGMRPIAGEKQK